MFPVGQSLLGLISALWYAGAGSWTLLEATLEKSLISSCSSDNKVRASKPHWAGSLSPGALGKAGTSGLKATITCGWRTRCHARMSSSLLGECRARRGALPTAPLIALCPKSGYQGTGGRCCLLCSSHVASLAFPNAFCRAVTVLACWEPQNPEKQQ